MTIKTIWTWTISCVLLGSCTNSPKTQSCKDIVTDSTINTIKTAGSDNDSLLFNISVADCTDSLSLTIGDSLEGCHTGKHSFKQQRSDNDTSLGEWEKMCFEGILPAADCKGIQYQLNICHREHSGDGHFLLSLTYLEADNGKDKTFSYTGSRYTQRGIPADKDATVWQLISEADKRIFNFLYEDEQTLILLNDNFEKNSSELNYTLKRIK